ncbi:MAG: peptidoglycan bridge formation glycyltransferase FemA/FemB family protein [bacterium]|nr:peptidoglycan bridge formation glycyltransferase FemA/FemB family protein [bacterium]
MLIREAVAEEKAIYNQKVNFITQSWEWGEFRESTGIKVARLLGFEDKKPTLGLQIFFHPLPRTDYTVGYIPRPAFFSQAICEAVVELAAEKNCIFVKVEPDLGVSAEDISLPEPLFLNFQTKSILPKNTFHIDLRRSPEKLLSLMQEKTRYNIKLAEKHKVKIREGETAEDFRVFINLQKETAIRQGFEIKPDDYFLTMWKILKPQGILHFLLAEKDKTFLGAIALFHFKDAFYYPYGGSSELHREFMANYLLHREAIKLGQKFKCETYDLWGAYKESPEPIDPWYGIYRFKKGFGGELVSYPAAFDIVINPQAYKVYNLVDFLRWEAMRAKEKIRKYLALN